MVKNSLYSKCVKYLFSDFIVVVKDLNCFLVYIIISSVMMNICMYIIFFIFYIIG